MRKKLAPRLKRYGRSRTIYSTVGETSVSGRKTSAKPVNPSTRIGMLPSGRDRLHEAGLARKEASLLSTRRHLRETQQSLRAIYDPPAAPEAEGTHRLKLC